MKINKSYLFVIITVLSALVIITYHSIRQVQLHKDQRSFIVVSAFSRQKDPLANIEEASNGAIYYRRSESVFGKAFLPELHVPQAEFLRNKWVLLIRYSAQNYGWSMKEGELKSAISLGRAKHTVAEFPLIPWAILIGTVLGVFVLPAWWAQVIGTCLIVSACSYRLISGCVLCDLQSPASRWLALFALTLYSILGGSLLCSRSLRNVSKFVLGIAFCGCLVQFCLTLVDPNVCKPCSMVGLMQGLFVGSLSTHLSWLDNASVHLKRASRLLLSALASGIIGSVFAFAEPAPIPGHSMIFGSTYPGPGVLLGRTVDELGIKKTPNQRKVIALVMPGCKPCAEAEAYLIGSPSMPVQFLSMIGANSPKLKIEASQLSGTPTFLCIDEHGTVVDQSAGWSPIASDEEAVLANFSEFLTATDRSPSR